MSLIAGSNVSVSADLNRVARWASTFSALLQVGFVCLGPEGQVEDATPTACEFLGAADPQDLRSRWSAIHEQLAPSLRAGAELAPLIADISFEIDGQSRRVQCQVHALTRDEGAGYLLLVQSSERVTALEGVLYLASRYQTLASLYSTTAHDFKGSLNAMHLHVELLGRTLDPGAPRESDAEVRQRCLQAVRQELDQLAQSLDGVLEESRLDQAQPSRYRPAAVLESIRALLRAHAARQRVTIRVVADDTIEIMGHASEIRQAVLNLAINALEAMPQGGELVLDLKADGPVAVLTVSDTGSGVPGNIRHRIWDLHFSTKAQGHGIGLHVVQRAVRAHGGTVTLDRTDSGAQFTLRLPLAR